MSVSVWRGAFLLTIVAVAVKVMSAAYRIPYQNVAGDLGFYVYQQIYPFFAVAVFLAAYGFPAAISKLVAARLAEGDKGGAASVMTRSLFVLSGFSIPVFLALYSGAGWICEAMGDERLLGPLRIVAFSFLFIPPLSAIRGFFQGHGVMKPTATSQIIEQLVRAVMIIGFTVLVIAKGYGAYAAGSAAGSGSVAGMAASCVLLILLAVKHRILLRRRPSKVTLVSLIKSLAFDGAAFSISSLALVFFLLIDTFTILPLLGADSLQNRLLVGVYDRGYPLVQLATAAAMSFSLAFVPAMARAKVRNDQMFIQEKSEFALRLCLAFGAAAVVGLALIVRPCNIMLFTDASGSGTLAWFGVTILFSMTAMTTAGILQALGFTRSVLIHTIIGLLLKLGLNLCLIPYFDTFGAATATVVSFALIAGLNSLLLHRETRAFSFLKERGIKLVFALLIMVGTLTAWHFGASYIAFADSHGRMTAAIVALGGAGCGAGVYLMGLVRMGYFSKSELTSLSKREKTRQSA
ncbi:MAG TPA: polysaccharide biosynthesis protein [Bacillales bacterium]|nr:polysaccharide biosynthesis protein [Bacillales bacterium]